MRSPARWLLACAALGALAWLSVAVAAARSRRARAAQASPEPLVPAEPRVSGQRSEARIASAAVAATETVIERAAGPEARSDVPAPDTALPEAPVGPRRPPTLAVLLARGADF